MMSILKKFFLDKYLNFGAFALKFIGKSISEIDLRVKYKLLALTTIKPTEVKSIVGKNRKENRIQGVAKADTILEKDDILVVYGANNDLRNFTN
jgi:trk system potassium uptake protein TrkA